MSIKFKKGVASMELFFHMLLFLFSFRVSDWGVFSMFVNDSGAWFCIYLIALGGEGSEILKGEKYWMGLEISVIYKDYDLSRNASKVIYLTVDGRNIDWS